MLARILCILAAALPCAAQVTFGSLSGMVVDPSGGAIPHARITIADRFRGQSRTGSADARGRYSFGQLRPSTYSLSVEAIQFTPAKRENIEISAGVDTREMLEMQVAGATASLTVEARAEPSAQPGLTLDGDRIRRLPLNRRDFLQLALLAPGVELPVQNSELSKRGQVAMHVNGGREEFNQFLLDGVDNNDPYNNRFLLQPPLESIEEFRVETNSYGAEYGRAGAGQVNIVTRSGTNTLHGDLYEYLRNRALDARNFFDGSRKGQYQRNQFGGAIGGPIRRNRTFYYLSAASLAERQGLSRKGTVPSAEVRSGDLSSLGKTVFDPFTQRPFPGNLIPAARIARLAPSVLALFPAANLPGVAGNFLGQPVLHDSVPQGSAKLDHDLGRAGQLAFRYSYGREDIFEPYAEESQSLPGFGNRTENSSHSVLMQHSSAFAGRWLHALRLGYARSFRNVEVQNSNVDVGAQWGVSWLNVRPRDHGYPTINVAGYSTAGDSTALPLRRYTNSYQIAETLQRNAGAHFLKFGGDLHRQEVNGYLDYFSRGQLSFGGALSGSGISDLLLGLPQTSLQAQFDNPQSLRSYFTGLSMQDDWKLGSRLTLNLGVRYDYFSPPTDPQNRMSAFDPASQTVQRVGTGNVRRSVLAPDRNNFAPRLALAYAWDAKTVVRAGYGIYYDAGMFVVNSSLYFNPPYFNFHVWFPTAQVLPTLENPFPANSGIVPPPTLNTISPDIRTAYLQHWSAGVERQIAASTTVSLTYAASKGTNLIRSRDTNQPLPGPGDIGSRRPLPKFGGIFFSESGGNSLYNSLQANWNRRMSGSLSFLGSYTFSKSIDDTSAFLATPSDKNFPQDSRNYAAERALSSFDATHRLAASLVWRVRGFELRSIVSAQSGQPFTPVLRFDNSNTGNTGGTFGSDRPNLLHDPRLQRRSPDEWFDTSAFAVPPRYQFGNAGRNIVRGPAYVSADAAVARRFAFGEALHMEASVEAFNLMNRANFNQPEHYADDAATFGQIFSAKAPRQLQLSLRIQF